MAWVRWRRSRFSAVRSMFTAIGIRLKPRHRACAWGHHEPSLRWWSGGLFPTSGQSADVRGTPNVNKTGDVPCSPLDSLDRSPNATSDINELRRPRRVVDLTSKRRRSAPRIPIGCRASPDVGRVGIRSGEARVPISEAADAALTKGEALLVLGESHRAKACFEMAVRFFDEAQDLRRAARARLGLAKVLFVLEDPANRAVLEDAGELYEEIGDEETARVIDRELRRIQADFEESPRSFHASPGRLRAVLRA